MCTVYTRRWRSQRFERILCISGRMGQLGHLFGILSLDVWYILVYNVFNTPIHRRRKVFKNNNVSLSEPLKVLSTHSWNSKNPKFIVSYSQYELFCWWLPLPICKTRSMMSLLSNISFTTECTWKAAAL